MKKMVYKLMSFKQRESHEESIVDDEKDDNDADDSLRAFFTF